MEELDYFKIKNQILDILRKESDSRNVVHKVQHLVKDCTKDAKDRDKKEKEKHIQMIIEFCIRKKLDEDLRLFIETDIPPSSKHDTVNLTLKLCLILAEKGVVRSQTLFILIQDTFEALSTKECVEWFSFIEKNTEDFRQLLKSASDVNVNGLAVRALTGLMRRLSKTNDIVFCGRVLMTLSRIMPLLDPSGINPKGLINRANITNFQSQETETLDMNVGLDQDLKGTAEISDIPIDYQFHHQFWSMMQYLQDPDKAYPDSNWETLCNYIRQVLRAFSNITTLQNEECAEIVSSEAYFTKFLTSQKLIQLEAQDPYFRRHVLIQLLIFYQALRKSSLKNIEVNLSDNRKNTLDEFEKKNQEYVRKNSGEWEEISDHGSTCS